MMKKTVLASLIIATSIASFVFIGGFVQKQLKERALTNTVKNTGSSNTQPGTQPTANSQAPASSYSATDVATHNNPKDCWIIIHSNVYGVSDFLTQHPGGARSITPYCGQDATTAFEGQGHSNFANDLLKQYLLGSLK